MAVKQYVLRPVITEKYTRLMDLPDEKQYAFEVAPDANKIQIKQEIESRFGVEVKTIRTYIKAPERSQRYTRTQIIHGKTRRIKRAVVSLAPGQEIDVFASV